MSAPVTVLGVECAPERSSAYGWRGAAMLDDDIEMRVYVTRWPGHWSLSVTWRAALALSHVAHTIDASGPTLAEAEAALRELMPVHLPREAEPDDTHAHDYVDGRNARRDGAMREACPHYVDTGARDAWHRGWDDVDREERR